MSANSLLVATPQLRWVRKPKYAWSELYETVLQQYFTDPLGMSGKGEWRDIPTVVTENQQRLTEPPTLEN